MASPREFAGVDNPLEASRLLEATDNEEDNPKRKRHHIKELVYAIFACLSFVCAGLLLCFNDEVNEKLGTWLRYKPDWAYVGPDEDKGEDQITILNARILAAICVLQGWNAFVIHGIQGYYNLNLDITFNLLRHQQDIGTIKECSRGIWNSIALVAALMLTVAISIAMNFDFPRQMQARYTFMTTLYGGFALLAAMQLTDATLRCIMHLVYTEPLSEAGVTRYIISLPTCIGQPFLMVCYGVMNSFIALLLYVGLIYSTILMLWGFYACMLYLTNKTTGLPAQFWHAHSFSPVRGQPGSETWLWAEDDTTEPAAGGKRDCCTKFEIQMFRNRAQQAKQLEEKEKKEKTT